jgi:FkbM family methyltransferase
MKQEGTHTCLAITCLAILGIALVVYAVSRESRKAAHNVCVEGVAYEIRNPHDVIESTLLEGRAWSPDIVRLLAARMRPDAHFVNVGAHIGTVCIPLAKVAARVTAFEPFPKSFDHLKRNVELNSMRNVRLYNAALGDKHERVFFLDDSSERIKHNSGGMHVLTADDVRSGTRSAHMARADDAGVPCVTLDSLDLPRIDAMLVDVEGMEDKLLAGASTTLRRDLPLLLMEIWDDRKRREERMSTTRQQMVDTVMRLGYTSIERVGDDDFLFSR